MGERNRKIDRNKSEIDEESKINELQIEKERREGERKRDKGTIEEKGWIKRNEKIRFVCHIQRERKREMRGGREKDRF